MPLLVGLAYDITGSYSASLCLGAAAGMLGAVVMVPVRNYRHAVTRETSQVQPETIATHKGMLFDNNGIME